MDIQSIKNKLSSLKGEQKQAAIDAIKEILRVREPTDIPGNTPTRPNNEPIHPGNKPIPPIGGSRPPEVKLDPELLRPTSGKHKNNQANNNFDDPDDILNKLKNHKSKDDKDIDYKEKENQEQKNNTEKDPVSGKKPQIGDQGDPNSDIRKAEDAYRKANEYKEEAEEKAEQAKAEGDSDEEKKQKELADKASELADKASELADSDNLTSKEKARLKRIEDALHDVEIERRIRDETENAVLTSREKEKRRLQQQKSKNLGVKADLNAFKRSIDKFMKDQLAPARELSWKRPNKRYPAETGIVLKGKARVEKRNVPLLVVYFDQSGSWDNSDVEKGLAAIQSLNYYVKQHKLKLEVYYFSTDIYNNSYEARQHSGTLSANKLVEDIKRKRPNNVIIMTDSDPDHGKPDCPSFTVDGGVWLLFRNGEISEKLHENVRGKLLNEVFEI